MPAELSAQERRYVRIGATAIRIAWVGVLALLFSPILIFGGLMTLSGRATGVALFCWLALTLVGLFAAIGVWILVLFKARCPACRWMLLRNPKKMGPAGFKEHPACPKIPGFNAWSYQVMRVRKERKLRCLGCGQDFDVSDHLDFRPTGS